MHCGFNENNLVRLDRQMRAKREYLEVKLGPGCESSHKGTPLIIKCLETFRLFNLYILIY